jgi:hypothetical protein
MGNEAKKAAMHAITLLWELVYPVLYHTPYPLKILRGAVR